MTIEDPLRTLDMPEEVINLSFWGKMAEIAEALSPDAQRYFFLVQCLAGNEGPILIDRTPEDRDLIFASILGFSSGVNALSEEAAILKVGVLREEIKRCFIAWNEANKVVNP